MPLSFPCRQLFFLLCSLFSFYGLFVSLIFSLCVLALAVLSSNFCFDFCSAVLGADLWPVLQSVTAEIS